MSKSRVGVLKKELDRRPSNDGSPGGLLMGRITTSNWM